MKPLHALALLPLALGVVNEAAHTPSAAHTTAAVKEFHIPVSNLRDWAGKVVVTLDGVKISGHSSVHTLQNDCEMHLGAQTDAFSGDPDGLVLEPMNACVEALPGKDTQSNADWTGFGDDLTNSGVPVTAEGVARIWPEHLVGGGPSNPNHAVELHPLTALTFKGALFDFTPTVFAGDYQGGVGEPTALNILKNTSVSVAKDGDSADISFAGGVIGNFTILEVEIDRSSITSDGSGSFRMDGDVAVDASTSVAVRVVSAKNTAINGRIQTLRSGGAATLRLQALVLFSLSPESLLTAVNKSSGDAVDVERPIQLILYGTPGDK
jgi:hypothetical protein